MKKEKLITVSDGIMILLLVFIMSFFLLILLLEITSVNEDTEEPAKITTLSNNL